MKRRFIFNRKDIGFGAIATEKDRLRLINRDGSFNVERKGLPLATSLSLYHYLLDITWTKFFGLAAIGYLLLNLIFASIYVLTGDQSILVHRQTEFGEFLDAFFFSVQTSSTIGFGSLSPSNLSANIVVTIESFVGLLGVAVITGLLFARFSKPNAKILFSDKALIAPYKDINAFMFRIANARDNQLFELEAELNLVMQRKEGETINREFHKLNLEISKLTFFPLSWTIVHPIDESSPLYGMSKEELVDSDPEFYIYLKGVDDTFNQYVYTRSSYKMTEIEIGAKFDSIFDLHTSGKKIVIDIGKLSNYSKAELN